MKILLLDLGSSFIKYSFYDNLERTNSDIFSLAFPKPVIDSDGRYEVDRRKIDEALLRIMDDAEAGGCTAAFICVQMHGYLIKYQGGFSNYISWKDKRGLAYLNSVECRELFNNGTVLKANLPRVSLQSFPSLSGGEFFTLGSYITYVLTGKNETHITDACASGLFNADTCAPDNPFEGLSLPTALGEIKSCGKYKGIEIYPPMGDHQVSFLGAGAFKGDAVLNLGTAAQLCALTDKSAECFEGIEYRPYFVKKQRLATISGICSADKEALISRIKDTAGKLGKIQRILISGGATDIYSFFESELKTLGYELELCRQNVGNDGLRRIADSVYSRRGTMLSEIEFVNFPFILKKAELDFFIIDNEHGSFENKTVMALAMNARSVDIQAIVRLPNNDRAMITKLADGGVSAFLLPMTNRKEDIEKVVEYAKYSPAGKRGISTTRAHTGYGVTDINEYMKLANQRMKLYAQIETRAGVENVEKILDVPELEGIFIGPNDLSCDYSCMGDTEKIKELISVISSASVKKNKPCGIITTDKELIKHALLCGCSMVSYGSEINMLKKGATEITHEKYL
ncbi:MAG: hypothetical protein E7587_02095 [Ruminococcaceae bacterium]|nr:hypothetical protein [Oscillospiraceae bacterium]